MKKRVDYLIIGQGLSGTFLAFHLLQKQKSFLIIDQGLASSSSYIAAGLINPIALKRLSKAWRSEEFLAYNASFYPQLESFLQKKYVFPLPMQKLILSENEEYFWQFRCKNFGLSNYIDEKLTDLEEGHNFSSNFKKGNVKQTSWLNISALLTDFRAFLKQNELILETSLNYAEIEEGSYNEIEYDKVVFCEGANATNNPFFKDLPFALNKGQLITIRSNEIPSQSILKKGAFILPVGERLFKVGATFSWKWEHNEIDKGKTEVLKQQIAEITKAKFQIEKESCGLRPASRDRRPLIGQSKEKDNAYIFNGMGSKGCFMAPLLVHEFFEYVENGTPLDREASIERFKPNLSA